MNKRADTKRTRGFTILEILLAMLLLAGTLAILGNIARDGVRNALAARDATQAELLCESILAQIRLGIIDLESVSEEPVTSDLYPDTEAGEGGRSESLWVYTVDVQTIDDYGLLEVAVLVRQNVALAQRPAACRLVRWLSDPALETEEETEDES
ncbi:MAG TPA: hypothetical protein DEB39_12095 [Planctomycetaceae bacterium]|nr:hypothetical protein [Planctomycetaceae bacterium]